MKLKFPIFLSFWIAVFLLSCNRDDISFDPLSSPLSFSTDTVFCDTVFHQVRSETYAVKVYNNEDKDITIPRIRLEDGTTSLYRINVDGKSGFDFTDVPLRRKDSLYIFVEIAPVSSGPETVAEDRILFTNPSGDQHVTLFSVVNDAEFFVQTDTNPNELNGNVIWNNDKAKVIYGDLTLTSGTTLNIEEGTKVIFFKNSGMKVSGGATVNVNGNLGSEVTFRGDRSDPKYDTIPKNWNAVVFEPNSNLNMNYARVFGGITGLKINHATANIQNTIVHTFEDYGIHSINSTINAQNLVMNNCGKADFGIEKGGNYDLTHVTLSNYWKFGNLYPALSLYASNEWMNENGQTETAPLSLNVKNSILYTPFSNAVEFHPTSGVSFAYILQNCLMNYSSSSAGFDFDGNPNVVNCIQNEDPEFMDTLTQTLNLRVETTSPTKGVGNTTVAATVPFDLVQMSRTSNPTLGAYQ